MCNWNVKKVSLGVKKNSNDLELFVLYVTGPLSVLPMLITWQVRDDYPLELAVADE